MNPEERDDGLHRVLARWTAPVVPEGMDDRVLAAFRKRARPSPWWSPLFAVSVRVPLPVALAVVLALLLTTALAFRRSPASAGNPSSVPEAVESARSVEPPVVTRTSLAGFRPVSEVTATVVAETKEGRP